jgi:hypothetical protein
MKRLRIFALLLIAGGFTAMTSSSQPPLPIPDYCTFSPSNSLVTTHPTSSEIALVERFRPYFKTSMNGSYIENYRPASWQWFVDRVSFVSGYKSSTPSGCAGNGTADDWPNGQVLLDGASLTAQLYSVLATYPYADVRKFLPNDVDPPDEGYAMHLDQSSSRTGEDWDSVVHQRHGLYAHVELTPDANLKPEQWMINIEYTIFWAYNEALCSHHNGDITTLVVVYDPTRDLPVRVTYSMHGYALEIFPVGSPEDFTYDLLPGRDQAGNALSVFAMRVNIPSTLSYQQGGSAHSPGLSFVRLAQDPVSRQYTHPVVYVEQGSHEFWPNETGALTAAPQHNGNGFSFLPDNYPVLDTSDNSPDHFFLFLNGKFGSDPHSIMLHRTWFWPEGRQIEVNGKMEPANRYCIADARLTDHDPYEAKLESLTWPPTPSPSGTNVTAYVSKAVHSLPHDTNAPGTSSPTISLATTTSIFTNSYFPFPNLESALSVVPCEGTIAVAAGTYPEAITLARQCPKNSGVLVKATGGAVTIGAGRP